ncbi:hypothetical protein NKG94_27335 [Micromonospora sp. M12]
MRSACRSTCSPRQPVDFCSRRSSVPTGSPPSRPRPTNSSNSAVGCRWPSGSPATASPAARNGRSVGWWTCSATSVGG